MMKVNPWVAFAVLALAVGATVVFSLLHIPEVGVPSALLAVGIALLQGSAHQETKNELTTLRASMHPPREPSMHDIDIPK